MQISYRASIGNRIRLPHRGFGVVISHYATIGNDCTIFHGVTIGVNESRPKEKRKIVIGNNVYLSAGCKCISCKIGEYSKIGPNAVVYKDIPPRSLVYSLNEIRVENKN